jgi:hypothetical protein
MFRISVKLIEQLSFLLSANVLMQYEKYLLIILLDKEFSLVKSRIRNLELVGKQIGLDEDEVKADLISEVGADLISEVGADLISEVGGLELADPEYFKPATVDILLGSDLFWSRLEGGVDRSKPQLASVQHSGGLSPDQ